MKEIYQKSVDYYTNYFPIDIKKGPNNILFTVSGPNGNSESNIFDLLPFVHLIYSDIHSRSIPGNNNEMPTGPKQLQFNYCYDGKTELMLDDQSYIYMERNAFCLSTQSSQGECFFPLEFYQGISIYFEDAFFSNENLSSASLLIPNIKELHPYYLSQSRTFLGEATTQLKIIMEQLWELRNNPEIFRKKICIFELLNCLMENKAKCEKQYIYYNSSQVDIAKKAEQILTKDLSQHIPIKTIAKQFGVSETSLKNYFKAIYGKNISCYLRDLRMKTAETELIHSTLSISEIAARAGYSKQGKFTEVFKSVYGQAPLAYRRKKKMESI